MPCHSGTTDCPTTSELEKINLDIVTRLLCYALSTLNRKDLLGNVFDRNLEYGEDLENWWNDHCEFDQKRMRDKIKALNFDYSELYALQWIVKDMVDSYILDKEATK